MSSRSPLVGRWHYPLPSAAPNERQRAHIFTHIEFERFLGQGVHSLTFCRMEQLVSHEMNISHENGQVQNSANNNLDIAYPYRLEG